MELKKTEKVIEQAEINYAMAGATVSGLQLQTLRNWECQNGIHEGDNVYIDYEEGKEKVVYEGYASTGWCVWVKLRHYTKKGKLYKNWTRYDWDIIKDILK